jgi:predicted regulator of Ras-like GTPase activity (Roadblock/LC7/MglB family)
MVMTKPRPKPVSPLAVLLARITRLGGVVGATLATREGLLVASAGRPGAAEWAELRSATTAALFGSLDRSLPSLRLGEVESAVVETTAYTLFLHGVGGLVLAAVAEKTADRASVQAEVARVASVLSRVERPKEES